MWGSNILLERQLLGELILAELSTERRGPGPAPLPLKVGRETIFEKDIPCSPEAVSTMMLACEERARAPPAAFEPGPRWKH